jgi:mitochondrial fission protein ELM1
MAVGPTLWVLADHRAGNRSQALGVAEATGLPFVIKELTYGRLADLPGVLLGRTFLGLTEKSRKILSPPWPDAAIAAGRRAATVARAIKRLSGGETCLLQIMIPRGMPTNDFDIVAAPAHDSPGNAPNIVEVTGAPHRITGAKLRGAAEMWEDAFALYARPLIVVLIGGSTRRRAFTTDMARDLGARANGLALRYGGTLLISTSPRTDPAAASAFLREVTVPKHVFRFGDDTANPYQGYLALADFVIVTGDSVSMCCEALASPAPTYIYAPPALTAPRHAKFHRELYAGGYARPLGDTLEQWPRAPLNEAHRLARLLNQRIGTISELDRS